MPGKMPRPSGACDRPSETRWCPGILVISAPSNRTRPRRAGRTPEIIFRVVVLPAPLAPMRATISPAVDAQRDPLERLDLAVEDVDVFELKQHG